MTKLNSIWLIDDDGDNNFIHTIYLEEAKVAEEIVAETRPEKALDDLLEKDRSGSSFPDLIFIDINMPLLNGYEFVEEYDKNGLSERHPNTKLYLLSTTVFKKDIERSKLYKSLSGLIMKPLTDVEIKQVMEEIRPS